MKTSTFPSLRVAPELRAAAEDVLREGESLSGFVEASVRAEIDARNSDAVFIARGLASGAAAKRSGAYVSAEDVMQSLQATLGQRKRQNR